MLPAVVYPLPDAVLASTALVVLLASAALPLYLLVFRPTGGRAVWGLSEMLAITLLFLVTLPLAAVMAGVALPLSLSQLSAVTLVQNAMFVGAPAYVVAVRYRLPLARLGVRLDAWPRLALVGAAAAMVAFPMAVASEEVAVYLIGLIEGPAQAAARVAAEHAADPLRPVFEALTGVLPIAWSVFLLAVIVPVGEEVFFRGFVYGGLRARWGVATAALASAAFFAVAHAQLVHGVPIFLLGVILALLYERTGSLLPAVITHAVNNVIATLSIWLGWGI